MKPKCKTTFSKMLQGHSLHISNIMHSKIKLIALQKYTEAVNQRCSVKKMFLEIAQNLQENNCARVSFFCEISKNTFSYRTPPPAASEKI